MSLFSKRLMKWREPKIKGMLTPKNVFTVFVLILIVSIPFGFLGGNGRFHVSTCFLGFGFMSLASIVFLIQPLCPGTLIQLREDNPARKIKWAFSTTKETVTSRFQFGILEKGLHFKYLPFIFTQEGVTAAKAALKSPQSKRSATAESPPNFAKRLDCGG
jgi:hypothetical protein